MVRQQTSAFSLCLLIALLVPGDANAQHYYPAQYGPRESAPLVATYSQQPTTPVVASQTAAPCGACSNAGSVANSNPFTAYQSSCCNATCSPDYGYGFGPTQCCQPMPRDSWYASAAGLYMDRSKSRRVWTTYENNNNANQLMNTHDADTDWEAGADLRLGRSFACNRWALELGYWSVNNFEATSSQTHANGVSSPLQFNDLEFAIGDPVANYFDNAAEHRLSRSNELHNVELNIIEGQLPSGGCGPWSHRMLFGVRYFKFDEDLTFSTLDLGGTWGGNGGLDQVALSDSVKNDLVGVQLGCLFERQVGCRTRFFVTPKFGVYNNRVEHRFDLRRGDGTAAMPTAFSGVSGSYPVESRTDVVSFLSEANIGLQYQASARWTLFGGYRVVVLTNVGLADNQIPQFIVDIPEIADIDTDGSLVLQGAFFGATRQF